MKFYLSSYKLGGKTNILKAWLSSTEKKVGYIHNALDYVGASEEKCFLHCEADIHSLEKLGFDVELLDLKNYFGKKDSLSKKLQELDMIWVSGGNTFVLRQAMYLSGFDQLIKELSQRDDFVYGGYSAGCCVLSPSLEGLQIVDDPNNFPYKGTHEVIWEGLGLIDYMFLPHYDSDHPESEDIAKEVAYCEKNGIPFQTIQDGEVFIIE